MQPNCFFSAPRHYRGVALVTVLSVLTVLAVLAAAFAVFTSLDQAISRSAIGRVQADMLVNSALEHALSLLRQDVFDQPAWDYHAESWAAHFKSSRGTNDVDVSGFGTPDARWFYIRNDSGRIIGRYAVVVEDESAKINVNVASAYGGAGQHQGFGPFEIALSGDLGAGLPFNADTAKRLIAYRYGRDGHAGQANADDNYNASTYVNDEIDNNANGLIDEPGEGIDEPEEYTPLRPKWDDQAFSAVDEVVERCAPAAAGNAAARRAVRRYATVHSRSRDVFFDHRINSWRKQANLNVATRDQVRRIMNRANAEARFESMSKNLRGLVANLMDYRDENHVLTTVGSEYGVEAVAFNEIVAYDASFFQETDYGGWGDGTVLSFNRMYGADRWNGGDMNFNNRWQVDTVRPSGNGEYTITIKEPRSRHRYLNAFLECERTIGGWPRNLWRGATHGKPGSAWIGPRTTAPNALTKYEVVSSAQGTRQLIVRFSNLPGQTDIITNNSPLSICLENAWQQHGAMYCDQPEHSELFCFMVPNPSFPTIGWGDLWHADYKSKRYYYQVVNANHCFEYLGPSAIREMDMDGDGNNYSVTRELLSKDGTYRLQYLYKNGQSVRQTASGFMPVLVTSSSRCKTSDPSRPGNFCNFSDSMYFLRPDVVELINMSSRPISLRSWSVVINTGAEALDLATIDSARYYRKGSGKYDDPSPRIAANGFFYLTNNRELFGADFCDGNMNYGSSQKEMNPVAELPERDWGITYKITRVPNNEFIYVDGADWKTDQLKGEFVEYVVSRKSTAARDVPNGQMKVVFGNGRNYVRVSHPLDSGLRAGDRIRVRGLPRQGGFVSFTLKNEYGQICSRTVEYGSVDVNDIGCSVEKYDPAHYTWVKSLRPTVSGDPQFSVNNAARTGMSVPTHIKDNRFVSVGEVQKVRKASDWENIGSSGKGAPDTRTLKAIAQYFTTAGVRLDAEEQGAYVSGAWRPAFAVAATRSQASGFRASGARWEPNIWAGQTLRIMSGPLAGEMFFITNSTGNGITTSGFSIPSDKSLSIQQGTSFSVGPGYSTPLFYTRQNGSPGVWEWQHKELEPMSYGLYLFGLSDAIKTTEFLEENWNARLDVEVWNFANQQYDAMPCEGSSSVAGSGDDIYQIMRSANGLQYDKSDCLYAGLISPHHISSKGGLRIRISARGLSSADASGFAWFDYAYLAPASILGKLNINTASPRVLAALRHITPRLAANIATGADVAGRPRLLPYKNITDILNVRGVTPDIFSDIANLITTRSDQFRVQILAQAIEQTGSSPAFDPSAGDHVVSEVRRDVIVDRSNLTDDNPAEARFTILQTR